MTFTDIVGLQKANDNYFTFVSDLGHDRFKVADLDIVEEMYNKWAAAEGERKENKRIKRTELENRIARDHDSKKAKIEAETTA